MRSVTPDGKKTPWPLTLDQLRSLFSLETARRVVGVTPEVQGLDWYLRYREIRAYLERERYEGLWLAIDDKPQLFPAHCTVVTTDPNRGFDERAAQQAATSEQDWDPKQGLLLLRDHGGDSHGLCFDEWL